MMIVTTEQQRERATAIAVLSTHYIYVISQSQVGGLDSVRFSLSTCQFVCLRSTYHTDCMYVCVCAFIFFFLAEFSVEEVVCRNGPSTVCDCYERERANSCLCCCFVSVLPNATAARLVAT